MNFLEYDFVVELQFCFL